jgi:hypothetical protein
LCDGRPEVRTGRESRAREAAGDANRYSVDAIEPGGRRETRWPDLVLERPGRRVAIVFERTAKGRDRLARIVAATAGTWYDEVHFMTSEPLFARRLAHALAAAPDCRLAVAPWPRLASERRALVHAALAVR